MAEDYGANEEQNQQDGSGFEIVRGEGKAVAVKDRLTTPFLTKYERARLLGTRALQIR